jgi:hypothetical protein
MPIAGLGLHIIIAALCAIHVVRTHQPLYWLIILFSFPLLGSLVYFVVIYLPNSRLQRGARRAVAAAARVLDPERELREARMAFEDTPTAQTQMRLAAALLEAGAAAEAAGMYERCLTGPFADDLDIRFGAARACVACQRYPEAIGHLEAIRASNPNFRPDAITLLLARSYAGTSRNADARREFEAAVARFGTFEARAEYAIWALATGDAATARRLQTEMDQVTKRWNAHTRELNEPTMQRLRAAQDLAKRRA